MPTQPDLRPVTPRPTGGRLSPIKRSPAARAVNAVHAQQSEGSAEDILMGDANMHRVQFNDQAGKRPSAVLLAKLSEWVPNTAEREKDLIIWLNKQIVGACFIVPSATVAAESTKQSTEVMALNKALETLNEKGINGEKKPDAVTFSSDQLKESTDNLFEAINGVVNDSLSDISLEDVSSAASSVVDSIPFLGTIVATIKFAAKGVNLGVLAHEAYIIHQIKSSSFCLLEEQSLCGIQYFEIREGIKIGKDMAVTAGTAVSAAFGGGAIVATVGSMVTLVMNVTCKIIDYLEVQAANKFMKEGNLDMKKLGSSQILRLHLPHLKDVDTLTLLGIVSPGWKTSGNFAALKNDIQKVLQNMNGNKQENWLFSSLNWDLPSAEYAPPDEIVMPSITGGLSRKQNPWHEEYGRLKKVLETTDKYILKQSYRLYEGRSLLHDPHDASFTGRLTTKAKTTLKEAFRDFFLGKPNPQPQGAVKLPPIQPPTKTQA